MSEKQAEPLISPLDTLPRISLKGTEVIKRQHFSRIQRENSSKNHSEDKKDTHTKTDKKNGI